MILAKIRKAIGKKVHPTTVGAEDHTRYAANIDAPDEPEEPHVANNRRRSSDGTTTEVDIMSPPESECGSLEDNRGRSSDGTTTEVDIMSPPESRQEDSRPYYSHSRMAIWRAGVVTEPELW